MKHEVVYGVTQSGKTTYSIVKARQHTGPVFFYNPQKVRTGFARCDAKYSIDQIIWHLKHGTKLDYYPMLTTKPGIRQEELRLIAISILNAALKGRIKNLLYIVDEAHIYARHNFNNPLEEIFTRGLGLGIYGHAITQRPALISNTIFTQCEIKTYFAIEQEEWEYFRRHGVPIDDIQEQLRKAGKYHYIQKRDGEYTKPMKVVI